jgi:hypothetical protein
VLSISSSSSAIRLAQWLAQSLAQALKRRTAVRKAQTYPYIYTDVVSQELQVIAILPMLSAIARKDLLTNSQSNKGYVTGELDALIHNDTWYDDVICACSGLTFLRWTENHVGAVFSPWKSALAVRMVIRTCSDDFDSIYALACIDAYKAYGGQTYVDKAVELWTTVEGSQINVQSGLYGNASSLMCNGGELNLQRTC